MTEQPPTREEMRARFRETPLHALLELSFRDDSLDGGRSIVDMPVQPGAFGSSGNLHGGAIATLCDVACASAISNAPGSSFVPGVNTLVTADMHVRYLGRPRGESVRAEASVVRVGRQLIVAECKVLDSEDRVIATCDFAAMVVPLRQPLQPGLQKDPWSAEM